MISHLAENLLFYVINFSGLGWIVILGFILISFIHSKS